MTKHYKDLHGASASITTHKDGTATLVVSAGGKSRKTRHESEQAAYLEWKKLCS